MNVQTTLPSKSIKLKIQEREYEVFFPKTDQFINIQTLKSRIANDSYNELRNSMNDDTGYAVLLTDMIATYNILIPDLKKDINVASILSLEMMESKALLDTYLEQWLPFYQSWMNIITADKTKAEA